MTTEAVLIQSIHDYMTADSAACTDVAWDADTAAVIGVQQGMSLDEAREMGATHVIRVCNGCGRGFGVADVATQLRRAIETIPSGHDGVAGIEYAVRLRDAKS